MSKGAIWAMSAGMRNSLILAAALGLLCVATGAFAAHGLNDPRAQGWMRTGAEYGFVHVLASLACLPLMQAGARRAALAAPFFLAGAVVFTGTLSAMALGAPLWLGAITPIGGVLFMIGWGVLAWAARDARI